MILYVSGRTDIPAIYSEWFMNRYKSGFVDVRNPFNPKLVSRIHFDNVDLILFCSKNPIPILDKLKSIDKPILFHVTLTPYKSDIEVNVIDKKELIEGIKKLSQIIGKDNLTIRYDPIFISEKYNLDYHVAAFEKMCKELEGYVNKIIISFIDDYKNVRNNAKYLGIKNFSENDYKVIGKSFSQSAKNHGMIVHTCFEDRTLEEYGFEKGECLSKEVAKRLTGKDFKIQKVRKGKKCECVEMVDIGVYNSCKHFCRYCYANYDELKVNTNVRLHNPLSSLLIGELKEDDIIKERLK